jgi:hypothetical protein
MVRRGVEDRAPGGPGRGEDGMSAKSFCLGGLVVALLGLSAARGQDPASPLSVDSHGPPPYNPSGSPLGPQESTPPGPVGPGPLPPSLGPLETPNSWLTYPRPCNCCGPLGGNGPIGSELYVRTGVNVPIGGGAFGNGTGVLDTGWAIQGGARVLFFDPDRERAWTADLGVLNINNNSIDRTHVFPLRNIPARVTPPGSLTPTTTIVPEIDVTVAGLNQTYGVFTVGREWWLLGSGSNTYNGLSWRVGIDGGGMYGTAKIDFNEIRHRTDVLGGLTVSLHSDLEYPYGCVIFQAGFRAEYSYIWNDLLQEQTRSDIQYLNFMGTLGIRF